MPAEADAGAAASPPADPVPEASAQGEGREDAASRTGEAGDPGGDRAGSAAEEDVTATDRTPTADDGAEPGGEARAAPDPAAADEVQAPAGGPGAHPLVQDFLMDPSGWPLWAAVALLRWLMGDGGSIDRLVYRSRPSLGFSGSEIHDIGIDEDAFHLVLAAPGLAAPGSALPVADIARIVADSHRPGGGAIAYWLDGMVDRLMQAVESAETRTSAAFALATGADLQVVESVLQLAGTSAPLRAEPGGVLSDSMSDDDAVPVPSLAKLFVGRATAAGLESLAAGFTDLPVEVAEFIPVPMTVAHPMRIGAALGGLAIGREGEVAAAGVNLVLDGTEDAEAIDWARDPARSRSLAALCEAYVGSPTPRVFLYVDVAPEFVPSAALGGETAFGRAPVLGRPEGVLRVPIEPGESAADWPDRVAAPGTGGSADEEPREGGAG